MHSILNALRSWVQIIPSCPLFTVVQLRYWFELISVGQIRHNALAISQKEVFDEGTLFDIY